MSSSADGGLNGTRVAIVGGSAGIGLAVAQAASTAGARVTIGSSNESRIERALAVLGSDARGYRIDVTNDDSVAAFFRAAGPIDHLVYTAGDWARRRSVPGSSFSMSDAKASCDVRLWGLLRTIDAALPTLSIAGSITLTGGLLAHRPMKGQAMSSAVTGAVEHLAKGLAVDLAPIRVNLVVPGLIATDVWSGLPAEAIEAMVGQQPIPRIGRAEEVAEAYLAFMRSTYTTGQSLIADGGMMYR